MLALAALLEAGNARVRPQVRRQVPESWRRVLPLPIASFGYGILLGLGWTTYVLTLAVWALFALSFALGDPTLGLVAGLAFGIGRAVPIVLLAWTIDTERGDAVACAMAERPAPAARRARRRRARAGRRRGRARALDGARRLDDDLQVAPVTRAPRARDLVYEVGTQGYLRRGRPTRTLPGRAPAVGDDRIAWRNGDVVTVAERLTARSAQPAHRSAAPASSPISHGWLAYRVVSGSGDRIYARRLDAAPSAPEPARRLGQRPGPARPPHAVGLPHRLPRDVDQALVHPHRRPRDRQAPRVRPRRARPGPEPRDRAEERPLRAPDLLQADARAAPGGREQVLATLGQLATRDEGFGHGHTHQGSEPSQCHPERKPTSTSSGRRR